MFHTRLWNWRTQHKTSWLTCWCTFFNIILNFDCFIKAIKNQLNIITRSAQDINHYTGWFHRYRFTVHCLLLVFLKALWSWCWVRQKHVAQYQCVQKIRFTNVYSLVFYLFIAVFTALWYWCLSSATIMHFTPFHSILWKLSFIIILHLCLDLPCYLFFQIFFTKSSIHFSPLLSVPHSSPPPHIFYSNKTWQMAHIKIFTVKKINYFSAKYINVIIEKWMLCYY
jgi:hypothetical protein